MGRNATAHSSGLKTDGGHLPCHYRPPPPPPYQPSEKWFPWVVPTIIIVNVVLFIIAMYKNNCPAHSDDCLAVDTLGLFAFENVNHNPLLGPSADTLLKMGALEVKKVVEERQVWRLATCMWLHAGTFHVISNMLSFLFVGIQLEHEFGFVLVGLLYAVSGTGGSLLSALFVRTNISVGASGALVGLLVAMLSELIINWTIYEDKWESLVSLLLIITVNMAVGILPHVDNFAHLGGFATGFLLGFAIMIRPQFGHGFLLGFAIMIRPQFGHISKRKDPAYISAASRKSKYNAYRCVLSILATIILITAFTVGLVLLLGGIDGNEHCSWCHCLSCVPTPLWTCDGRCTSSQHENELKLTCMHSNKSKFYTLDSGSITAHVQQLCAQLCS